MTAMAREAWTDERLDDLAGRMDKGFERVDADIRELRSEMKSGFSTVNSGFNVVNSRIDSMQRTMIIGFASIAGSVIASAIGAVLAT
jgi:hypothetical protein